MTVADFIDNDAGQSGMVKRMCEHCEKLGFEFCQCKPKVQRTGNIYKVLPPESQQALAVG